MITVVTPVSVIPSHPETHILTETLDSVRHHLPDAELIVTFDGVRPEQEAKRADYEEHIRRMLWELDHHYGNAVPFIWDEHLHQVGMLRRVLDEIRTPLMLFVEQDTPLGTDELIAWQPCIDMITSGEADIIRYSHEGVIPEAHSHMMLGLEGLFMRTCQFSARPHLASVAYYRRVLASHFSPDARTYTEDVLHGVCHEAYLKDGLQGWRGHRLWLYHPSTGNIKRSYHLDGREGESKYEDQLVF